MRIRLQTFTALMVVVSVQATAAEAQSREPLRQAEAIPVDLATALAAAGGFQGESTPQILVGAMPEWVMNRVSLPPGARVLGSAFLGSTVVGVVKVAESSDTVLKAFDRELQRRGYRPPPARVFGGGGFRPAAIRMGEGDARRTTLCGIGQMVSAWISRQDAVSTTVVLRMTAQGSVGLCNPPRNPPDMERRPAMPTLYDPAAAERAAMECASSYQGSMGTGTQYKSSMRPAAILEHYGRQLQDSGWTPVNASSAVASQTWTRPDSAGATQLVLLTVIAQPGDSTCRRVNMDFRSPPRR